MSKHALLLDADYLVFSAMSAAEKETQWDDNVWTLETDHEAAWRILMNSIKAIVARKKSWSESKIVMCFTDDVNWRKSVLPTYKENRKKTRKPTGYVHFVEKVMAVEDWNSFFRPTLEGDDCLGIIATAPSIVGCDTATIVSCDKDFNTIPCEFFWLTTGEIKQISLEEANHYHMLQTLMGDTTDGYSGIKGTGKDTALAFLAEPYKYGRVVKVLKSGARKGQSVAEWKKLPAEPEDTLWDCMKTLAAKADMTEDELLVQAQVARICRSTDFNYKTKEVILWQPE